MAIAVFMETTVTSSLQERVVCLRSADSRSVGQAEQPKLIDK